MKEKSKTKRKTEMRIRAAILTGHVHTAAKYCRHSSGETQSWFSSQAVRSKKLVVATSTNLSANWVDSSRENLPCALTDMCAGLLSQMMWLNHIHAHQRNMTSSHCHTAYGKVINHSLWELHSVSCLRSICTAGNH